VDHQVFTIEGSEQADDLEHGSIARRPQIQGEIVVEFIDRDRSF
jgi:hypothetical protein